MRKLTLLILINLAAINIGQAEECQPPAGAQCSRDGASLLCTQTTCAERRCTIRKSYRTVLNGRCMISLATAYRVVVKPPARDASEAVDSRCRLLTEAQRATTDGC